MPHSVLGEASLMTVWLPDLFGAVVLIWPMVALA